MESTEGRAHSCACNMIGALSLALSVSSTSLTARLSELPFPKLPCSRLPTQHHDADLSYCLYNLGPNLEIAAINNLNQIVGSAALSGEVVQAFVWQWDDLPRQICGVDASTNRSSVRGRHAYSTRNHAQPQTSEYQHCCNEQAQRNLFTQQKDRTKSAEERYAQLQDRG